MWSVELQETQFPTVTRNTGTKTESPFPFVETGLENFIQEKELNMSLQRNQIPEQQNTDLTKPQLNLNDLYQKILSLREQDRQEAEDKLQLALLLATTEKMCRSLTDFMTATERELQKMNENQLNTLNIQEQYRKEIRADVVDILNKIYGAIQKQQAASFAKMLETSQKSVTALETKIAACTEKCKVQTANVKSAIEEMRKVENLRDILLWISPVAVIADLVIRIIQCLG